MPSWLRSKTTTECQPGNAHKVLPVFEGLHVARLLHDVALLGAVYFQGYWLITRRICQGGFSGEIQLHHDRQCATAPCRVCQWPSQPQSVQIPVSPTKIREAVVVSNSAKTEFFINLRRTMSCWSCRAEIVGSDNTFRMTW